MALQGTQSTRRAIEFEWHMIGDQAFRRGDNQCAKRVLFNRLVQRGDVVFRKVRWIVQANLPD
jgi:hypothetical protein